MPKAAIIRPPLSLSRDFIDYPWFAGLGSYQAAAVLAAAGWQVDVIDGLACEDAQIFEEQADRGFWLGQAKKPFLDRMQDLTADLVVLHADSFLRNPVAAPWLKEILGHMGGLKKGCMAVAEMVTGGMHYLRTDAQALMDSHPAIDAYLRFEGERLLAELASELTAGDRPKRSIREEHQPLSAKEILLPYPHHLDCEAFFDFASRVLDSPLRPGPYPSRPSRTLPVVTQRGCPFGCIFCSHSPGLDEKRHEVRSAPIDLVIETITDWKQELGLQRLVILDDVANLDERRFESLLGALEKLGLAVEFPNGLRADRFAEQHVERLSKLTSSLKVSMESASSRVQRDILDKRIDPEAVERVAAWCRLHGLPLQVHYMIGIPGETRPEIIGTLETALRLHRDFGAQPLLQYAVPLPGTQLERICCREGLFAEEPTDLHACFQHRPVIQTDEFGPVYLRQASSALERALQPVREKKVIVNLTYRCNNHCIFCAVGDRPQRDARTADVLRAMQRYREEGFELCDIDGGEPTLHPDLFEVIENAKSMGFSRVSMVTNGRRLSYENYASGLVQTGIDEVLVSLHSADPAIHAAITGVEDSFEQTRTGIENILSKFTDSERVAVNTTLARANLRSIPELCEMLVAMGLRRWNLQVVTPFGRAVAGHLPPAEDLQEVITGVLSEAPSEMNVQVINCPPCLLPGYEHLAAVDFAKAARDMVFVGQEGENLQAFLSGRRKKDERCENCLHSIICPGFYVFEDD